MQSFTLFEAIHVNYVTVSSSLVLCTTQDISWIEHDMIYIHGYTYIYIYIYIYIYREIDIAG